MVEASRVEPYPIEIVVVLEHIHGVIGDIDDAIVVIVALLHTRRANANDFKRDPIDADCFADGGHSGKKFVASFRRDDGIESVLHVVGIVKESSLLNVEVPD